MTPSLSFWLSKGFHTKLRKDESSAFESLDPTTRKSLEISLETVDVSRQFLVEGFDQWLAGMTSENLRILLQKSGISAPEDMDLALRQGGINGINFLLHLVFPRDGIPDFLPILEKSAKKQRGVEATRSQKKRRRGEDSDPKAAENEKLLRESPTSLSYDEIKRLRRPIIAGITTFELENHYWAKELQQYLVQRGVRLAKAKTKKTLVIKAILKSLLKDSDVRGE